MLYSGSQEQNAFQKNVTSLLQSKCSMDSIPCLRKVHMVGLDHF